MKAVVILTLDMNVKSFEAFCKYMFYLMITLHNMYDYEIASECSVCRTTHELAGSALLCFQ